MRYYAKSFLKKAKNLYIVSVKYTHTLLDNRTNGYDTLVSFAGYNDSWMDGMEYIVYTIEFKTMRDHR